MWGRSAIHNAQHVLHEEGRNEEQQLQASPIELGEIAGGQKRLY